MCKLAIVRRSNKQLLCRKEDEKKEILINKQTTSISLETCVGILVMPPLQTKTAQTVRRFGSQHKSTFGSLSQHGKTEFLRGGGHTKNPREGI